MRRLVLVHLVCWVALAAARCARGTNRDARLRCRRQETRERRPMRRRRRQAARLPPTARRQATPEVTRSLFEPTWNQFQFGGRLSSLDGDPARWQRYQDLQGRRALHRCTVRARRSGGKLAVPVIGGQRRLARSAVLRPITNAPVGSSSRVCGTRSRSSTASTPRRRTHLGPSPLLLDDATQRAIQNGAGESVGVRPDRHAVRSPGSDVTSAT